jgi:hypothetical protein
MIRTFVFCFFLSLCIVHIKAQEIHQYNLAQLWNQKKLLTDTATKINILEDKDHTGAITLKGTAWLKDVSFSKGTIDLDLRGKNVFLQSFLGIAFHGVNDSTYDVVYFRPFNFKHEDTARRKWSVQYMSMPDYDYDKLRKAHPLVYENSATPVPDPDTWFHTTLVVDANSVTVYVNNSSTASLKVQLLNNRTSGKIGLWSYAPGVSGDLALLRIQQK